MTTVTVTVINASTLFTGAALAAEFDNGVTRDAANGRIHAPLIEALKTAYNLALPASPKAAIAHINKTLLRLDKSPKVVPGTGGRASTAVLTQVLHAVCQAVIDAGVCKGLPDLLPLPAWADPVQLQARADAAKAAREARKLETAAAAVAVAETVSKQAQTIERLTAPAPVLAASVPDAADAVDIVIAAAKASALTHSQIDILRSVLETAQAAPMPTAKAKRTDAPVTDVTPVAA